MKKIIEQLVKIANELDNHNLLAEADEVTKMAKDLSEDGEREAETYELNRDLYQKSKSINNVLNNTKDTIQKTEYQRSR